MSNFIKKALKCFIFIVISGYFLTSCVTQRSLEYAQDRDKGIKDFKATEFQDYKIMPNDYLYIQISSQDEDPRANVFSNSTRQGVVSNLDIYGASLFSYTVDNGGYLDLPIVGKILVKEKTIAQVSAMIREALVNVLNQPNVSIKLVNRFVTVLGEVRTPGHYPFNQDKLSIYDAIGIAGDITDYGNRHEVILLRNENGKNIRINLNLSKSSILGSEYYFLRPNDIVYVKPLKRKFWGMREFPFSIILSAVTTAVLVFSYVNKL